MSTSTHTSNFQPRKEEMKDEDETVKRERDEAKSDHDGEDGDDDKPEDMTLLQDFRHKFETALRQPARCLDVKEVAVTFDPDTVYGQRGGFVKALLVTETWKSNSFKAYYILGLSFLVLIQLKCVGVLLCWSTAFPVYKSVCFVLLRFLPSFFSYLIYCCCFAPLFSTKFNFHVCFIVGPFGQQRRENLAMFGIKAWLGAGALWRASTCYLVTRCGDLVPGWLWAWMLHLQTCKRASRQLYNCIRNPVFQ